MESFIFEPQKRKQGYMYPLPRPPPHPPLRPPPRPPPSRPRPRPPPFPPSLCSPLCPPFKPFLTSNPPFLHSPRDSSSSLFSFFAAAALIPLDGRRLLALRRSLFKGCLWSPPGTFPASRASLAFRPASLCASRRARWTSTWSLQREIIFSA